MPTVMTIGPYRVSIYTNDHSPAHVHVIGGGKEAIFNLNCPKGPVSLRENHGMSDRDLSQIEGELNDNLAHLCKKWKEIHGH